MQMAFPRGHSSAGNVEQRNRLISYQHGPRLHKQSRSLLCHHTSPSQSEAKSRRSGMEVRCMTLLQSFQNNTHPQPKQVASPSQNDQTAAHESHPGDRLRNLAPSLPPEGEWPSSYRTSSTTHSVSPLQKLNSIEGDTRITHVRPTAKLIGIQMTLQSKVPENFHLDPPIDCEELSLIPVIPVNHQ